MTFAERLRLAWDVRQVPKSRLAAACKVSKGAVTQWFSGDTQPKSEAAMLLAQELGVSLDWLVLGRGRMDHDSEGRVAREGDGPSYRTARQQVRLLPLLDWQDIGAAADTDAASVTAHYPCLSPCSSDSYALRVQGDSMSPVYRDGEVLLVDPSATPGHNRDVVLRLHERPTFRRLQLTPEGRLLLALNPDHPERIQHLPDDAYICGVVIASYMDR